MSSLVTLRRRYGFPSVNRETVLGVCWREKEIATTTESAVVFNELRCDQCMQFADKVWQLLRSPLHCLLQHVVNALDVIVRLLRPACHHVQSQQVDDAVVDVLLDVGRRRA